MKMKRHTTRVADPMYRIYFSDSNQKFLEGPDMLAVIEYIEKSTQYSAADIVKIENMDWYS